MTEQSYGGIDRTTNKWWKSLRRGGFTEEELEILRRKMREAMGDLMKAPSGRG